MAEAIRAITWEAPEHHHEPKHSDWFWVLSILAIGSAIAALLFGNFLFAILILLGAGVMMLLANREPQTVPFAVTTRGLRIENKLYPYSTLDAYYIDEDNELGPQLLARSKKLFMPLIIMPLPESEVEHIEDLLEVRLPEEYMEEPAAYKVLEFLGF